MFRTEADFERDYTEIDFSDIRAVIAQTWALPIYIPLHVINFAKDVMNARPDRNSIHCPLLSSNDWYLAVVNRARACVEHCGTLKMSRDIGDVEKFLAVLASLLLISNKELGLDQFNKVVTPESAIVTFSGRTFSFNHSKPMRRSRERLINRVTAIYRITSESDVMKIS